MATTGYIILAFFMLPVILFTMACIAATIEIAIDKILNKGNNESN